MEAIKETCPHCKKALKIWEPSPYTGWGNNMLFCDNNECPYFIRGRKKIYTETFKNFAYRYCINPDNGKDVPIIAWCPGELSLKKRLCGHIADEKSNTSSTHSRHLPD